MVISGARNWRGELLLDFGTFTFHFLCYVGILFSTTIVIQRSQKNMPAGVISRGITLRLTGGAVAESSEADG